MQSTQILEARETSGAAAESGKVAVADSAVLEFLVRKNLEQLMDEFSGPKSGKSLHAVAAVKKFS